MKFPFIVLIWAILLINLGQSDVKSTTGRIDFLPNNQNRTMSLTNTGLGIGTTSPSANLSVQGNAIISKKLSIGTTLSHSNLHINGTFGMGIQTISGNVNLNDNSMNLVDSSLGNIHLTLPYAGNVEGQLFHIKKTSRNYSVYLHGSGNYIDNITTYQMNRDSGSYTHTALLSDGHKWNILTTNSETNTPTPTESDNLLAYYQFDIISDPGLDYYPGGNNATAMGLNIYNNLTRGTFASFDGVSDYLLSPIGPSLPSGNLSISFWVYVIDETHFQLPFSSRGVSNTGVNVFFTNSGQNLRVSYGDGTTTDTSRFDTTLNNSTWYHCVTVFEEGTVKNYLNGSLDSTDVLSITEIDHQSQFYIGAQYGGTTNELTGSLDNIRFYDIPLTLTQIQNIFNEENF